MYFITMASWVAPATDSGVSGFPGAVSRRNRQNPNSSTPTAYIKTPPNDQAMTLCGMTA